jgi:GTP-binding protein
MTESWFFMKVQSAEFVVSAVHKKDYPLEKLPQIAFAGRSNVGKSSLINTLLNRKRLVKTSSTPGRTQTINFFLINGVFHFVDLPGYGFARVPESVRRGFGPMVERYLKKNPLLAGIVHIVDIRHRPTEADKIMRDYLQYYRIPVLTVATKSDKISRQKRLIQLAEIRDVLHVPDKDPLLPFSAKTRFGKNEVWLYLESLLRTVSV